MLTHFQPIQVAFVFIRSVFYLPLNLNAVGFLRKLFTNSCQIVDFYGSITVDGLQDILYNTIIIKIIITVTLSMD